MLHYRWVLYVGLFLVVAILIWPSPPTPEQLDEGDGEGLEGIAQVVAILSGMVVTGVAALTLELAVRRRRNADHARTAHVNVPSNSGPDVDGPR